MKKYLILLATWAFACAITFASGNLRGEKVIVKIEKGDIEKTVVVRLANLEKMTTQVGILDVDGKSWFTDLLWREHGYATKFNMEGMPNGDYVLFIRNRQEIWAQTFNLDVFEIEFFQTPSNEMSDKAVASLAGYFGSDKGRLIACFKEKEGPKFSVQLANLLNEPTRLDIVSINHGTVYSKIIWNENGFHEIMNMVGAENGDYFLYVYAADATLVQFFKIVKSAELKLGALQRLERPVYLAVPDEGISIEQ